MRYCERQLPDFVYWMAVRIPWLLTWNVIAWLGYLILVNWLFLSDSVEMLGGGNFVSVVAVVWTVSGPLFFWKWSLASVAVGGVKNCNVVLAGCIVGVELLCLFRLTLGLPVIFCVILERETKKRILIWSPAAVCVFTPLCDACWLVLLYLSCFNLEGKIFYVVCGRLTTKVLLYFYLATPDGKWRCPGL